MAKGFCKSHFLRPQWPHEMQSLNKNDCFMEAIAHHCHIIAPFWQVLQYVAQGNYLSVQTAFVALNKFSWGAVNLLEPLSFLLRHMPYIHGLPFLLSRIGYTRFLTSFLQDMDFLTKSCTGRRIYSLESKPSFADFKEMDSVFKGGTRFCKTWHLE